MTASVSDRDSRRSGPDPFAGARRRMVEEQIRARGIRDEAVLGAMRTVPRHAFVPEELQARAYDDSPLSLGPDQTISQPYIVALMTEMAEVRPGDRVLEIGTGSGYQAAVLAELTDEVYTVEIDAELARRAADTLERLRYDRVHVRCGDGREGWPEHAPYDVILVTAATPEVPRALEEQAAPGARLILPAGTAGGIQVLTRSIKTASGWQSDEPVSRVRFVPLL